MKTSELKVKLDKAVENVTKREMTIQRQKAQLEKKIEAAKKLGCNPDVDTSATYSGGNNNVKFWAMCDVEDKREEISNSEKKLAELQQIAANWGTKMKEQVLREEIIATEMPAIFQQCKDDLAKDWTETDIKRRDTMRENRAKLTYKEFRKMYTYSQEQEYSKTDEEFLRANEHDAELFIIDLYNRVKAVTGEVTDWRGIHYGGKALNGLVLGKSGTARVETILAGGYNIQRLHMRVLVHEVK